MIEIVVNKEDVVTENHMPHSKMQLTNSKVLEKENLKDILMSDLNMTIYRNLLNGMVLIIQQTVRKIHNCLKQSIDDAIQEGLIHKDPIYKVVTKGTIPPPT